MWIEEELQRDSTGIQRSIQALTRDYHKQLPRSIRSRLPENKEKTTDFLNHFYDQLRNAEFNVYQKMTAGAGTGAVEADEPRLAFQLTEIKNSANDLPHPRILSELQRAYDMRRHGTGTDGGDDDDDRYIPYKVYAYIREKSEYCIQFQSTINGRAISLYFITFPESHIAVCNKNRIGSSSSSAVDSVCASEIAVYQIYAYKVFMWLSLVTGMAGKECSEKGLNVYFYMTPFKKQRPADDAILSAIHVNTGVTRNCETHGEIVVYRAEEWFKVFIHESMHNFNMDFIDLDLKSANEQLRRTFCIPHDDILLFETYTETWARIINTMFDTYHVAVEHKGAATRAHFIHTVREKLTTNAVFYAHQAVKVLEIMDLKYANITIQSAENTEVCRKRYAEDTNVYAYYILGGILSVYALPFISWCCLHNRRSGSGGGISAIRFSQETNNLTHFVDFITNAARDPVLLSLVSFIESSTPTTTVVKKTMRMTME
jgi:hypothetical protein